MIQIRTFPFPQLWCHPTPKALFKYEWHPVYVRINNMYTRKGLQKCKYCSAHKSLPLRLPRKIASGHKLVTISTAEASNEVKYICMCEGCKTLAPKHVPLSVWWQQSPGASVPLSSVACVTGDPSFCFQHLGGTEGRVSILHDGGCQSRWARDGFVAHAQVWANTVIMLKFA